VNEGINTIIWFVIGAVLIAAGITFFVLENRPERYALPETLADNPSSAQVVAMAGHWRLR